jgi:predicted DNA-binding transcriptional regulator AlpA
MPSVSKITIKKPAAQAAASKKAATLKAAAKRPQPTWLQNLARQLPPLTDESLPSAPKRMRAAHPRLLDKDEILTITGVSFPTVWSWMRTGKFPRSRVVGGKSMWLSTEIEGWLAALPVRKLKGDAPLEVA